MADEVEQSLPMFYKKPVVLNAKEHEALKLVNERRFNFAKNVNSVPVVLNEVPGLLPHYPVVFSTGAEPMLVALLGLRENENLFVEEDGKWQEGGYVPAYIRRYPFILARADDDNMFLSADLDCDAFDKTGLDMFKDGQPTDLSREMFRFCMEFQKMWDDTRKFCKEVYDAGLLEDKVCTLSDAAGKSIRLSGFSAVNEEKLDSLDNHTVNDWRKRHMLKFLYFHLASMERISTFPLLSNKRHPGQPFGAPAEPAAAAPAAG